MWAQRSPGLCSRRLQKDRFEHRRPRRVAHLSRVFEDGREVLEDWAGRDLEIREQASFCPGIKRLLPEIEADHLDPAPAGVRAQAVSRDGSLVDDFLIQETERVINVGNAPSPAATASLNIGKLIAERLRSQFPSS